MSTNPQIIMEPIGHVIGGRIEPTDDYWGGVQAIIRFNDQLFMDESLLGMDGFSHLEVVYFFHRTDLSDLDLGARRPRNNPEWPPVGNLAHRNMRKINRIGVSRCRILRVEGLDIHVEGLDAIHETPVLEVKPWFTQFGPEGHTRQPDWVGKMLVNYYASAPK